MAIAPAPVRVAGFGGAAPEHRATTDELAAVLAGVWPELGRRAWALLDQSACVGRHLARPPAQLATPLPPSAQTARYLRVALDLAEDAARKSLLAAGIAAVEVGLLVVASCTGFVLPGVDSLLVPRLGLRPDIVRMPFSLFGCGGGAAGLARACDWVRAHPEEAALVVAVELPSVTFRPDDRSLDNLLSALVFGDGAAALVVTAGGDGLAVGRTASRMVPDSGDALGYRLADTGLQVVLSRRLPKLIAAALPEVVTDFLSGAPAAELEAVAIHPGGPSIISAVERSLGLRDGQTAASWTTLRQTGNTSSAAILSVLGELAGSPPSERGRGLAIGFGPGLSIELLEIGWDTGGNGNAPGAGGRTPAGGPGGDEGLSCYPGYGQKSPRPAEGPDQDPPAWS
ncbi:MAG TPA: 3-oxoacyl-[acyl-carrier-protein] synthase III C-terminal domain-containing protein [Candidatus Binatia bacterium]|nr:3-oxoacyl-[acyl-carrier-protein] synthase III C-terminal domain-containing protein [Candidatus Binatia bacterium]